MAGKYEIRRSLYEPEPSPGFSACHSRTDAAECQAENQHNQGCQRKRDVIIEREGLQCLQHHHMAQIYSKGIIPDDFHSLAMHPGRFILKDVIDDKYEYRT